MKAGDLVVPASGQENDPSHKIGLVVEWDINPNELPASGWVKWAGDTESYLCYEDDIEVIAAAEETC